MIKLFISAFVFSLTMILAHLTTMAALADTSAGDEACKCGKPNTKHCEMLCLSEGQAKNEDVIGGEEKAKEPTVVKEVKKAKRKAGNSHGLPTKTKAETK